MRTIYSPSSRGLNRELECEVALEPAFMQLLDRAQQAGWCTGEVVGALLKLSHLAREQEEQARNQRRYA